MGDVAVRVLRIVLAVGFAGLLFMQVLMVILLFTGTEEGALADVRVPIAVILVLGAVTVQVTVVSVWRLLTMVRRDTVFSDAAFRYVDIVIGAAVAAAVLTLALAGTFGIVASSTEEIPPGGVLLVCGAAVMVAGVALIVYVLRILLALAVARDAEARHLQAELDGVV